jgi:N-acetylglucosamine-6-phosphate deacetylase
MGISLCHGRVITPLQAIENGAVVTDDQGRLAYVGPLEGAPRTNGLHLDLRGRLIVPGFVDIHQQGGNGVSFAVAPDELDTVPSRLESYSGWAVRNGVTGFLCSIGASSMQGLRELVGAFAASMDAGAHGAEALGIHLEGPYLSEAKRGAINPAWLRAPSVDEVDALLKAGRGWIRQTTLAPEVPGVDKVAAFYRAAGVVVAVGHSDADYEVASEALRRNVTHVTHAFNAQRAFDHRAPGLAGAMLASDDATVEVIADGVHVHPAVLKILVRCVGTDRVVLITDSMAAAGAGDGEYLIGGQLRIVKDGVARLSNGNLAGSVATMNRCVRNMFRLVGVSLVDAVKMASLNPARAMGFADRLGALRLGHDASLTVIDEEVNVYMTMVKGKIIYADF